ncbi:Protein kinase [Lachnellula hyalina]|uniref:Serine/threonine-protein kinase MEC1 n=1 Tax=Lachnellula hyalina TaxID=1316788 RepID=A0A8H8U248_9HELO|nr:Protein kinase [Lachnellula hyalina]TVY28597.1 Protein kinase [Lachnellula hyalina]
MNGYADEEMGGFEAPPSTMAAQLINNLSTTNKPSREPEQDDLKRLMTEVSELENSSTKLSNLDVKLEHKHKLIYVFARAVLERLSNDDPFINTAQLVSQASEALDIFTSTIRETPAVLTYILKPQETLQARGQEPLWMWLFPRVLTLLGRRECEDLTDKIKSFFSTSFQAVAQSPKLWYLSSLFFSYLKECASHMLNHLQNPSIIPYGNMSQITSPAEDFDYSVFSQQKDNSPYLMPRYSINEATHAFWHVNYLLTILVDTSVEAVSSFDATPAFQDYLAWMLDSFLSVHDLQKRWQANPQLQQSCIDSCLPLFRAVGLLLSSVGEELSPTILRKGYLLFSILCSDLLRMPDALHETLDRVSICRGMLSLVAICKRYASMRGAVSLHLLPTITTTMLDDNSREKLGKDFQKTALTLYEACQIVPLDLPAIDLSADFDNIELAAQFRQLGLESLPERDANEDPPLKRRKVHKEDDLFDQTVTSLYSLLGAQKATDLDGLNQLAESCFAALNETERCESIQQLANIPCAAHGSLMETKFRDGILRPKCFLCEGLKPPDSFHLDEERCQKISIEAIATFSNLIKSTAFLDSRRPRVLAMIALRRFTVHFTSPSFVDFEQSILGQWCLQSLKSSIRELRVAAGRTLPGFLCGPASAHELTRKNRINVLDLLRSFSETEDIHFQESCILAWGQVGRISNDDELNLVLLGLVKYLGHSNPIISGAAFNEILKLAKASDVPVDRMFSPFWGTVAIEAVKDLLIRPQTTQLMADLLGISVSEFLVLTQSHTLPWLVLFGKPEVIKKIAEARKDGEVWLACMANLVAILPLLLIQNVPDTETFVMRLFKAISPKFNEADFTELLRHEPASQAIHLLKLAGDADDSKKSRIHYALQYLAKHTHVIVEGVSRKNNPVGVFLEQHLLGLVARLSEVINDSRDEQPTKEKERCVKAFEELVRVAKTHTRTARPQICACLQSAVAQKELQASAFSAWDTLLRNLEDEDVEPMLESTFSTVIQRWTSLDETTRTRAKDTLEYLIHQRGRLIRISIFNLPSLSQFPELEQIEAQLNKWRTPTDVSNAFQIFSRRLGHENPGVVIQALIELKAYLKINQSHLQASAVSEQPDTVVGLLVRSILDTCVNFNGSHNEIAGIAAECIGMIGCLDSNRVESVREQREMILVSNFDDSGETTDFVLFMLEEVIVKAFLSATDTVWQGFLSYVMQELLAKCDFKEMVGPIVAGNEKSADNPLYRKWLKLPLSVQDTLTPFLSSKFSLMESKLPEYQYPIFRPENMVSDKVYNIWLRAFVLDLLQKPFNNNSLLLYPALCRAIRIKDISVASFLLPYVVLHVIILGDDQNRQEIGEELLRVLEYQVPVDSKVRKEDVKLCIEAVFRVLDYLSRWVQERQIKKTSRGQNPTEVADQIQRVDIVLSMIPPEIISQRAVECKSYSRALFYWEQHIRDCRERAPSADNNTELLERLQDIYTQIDEPDGIEGISAHLHVLDIEQQILGHRKAGRWTAAQSWYEIKLAENPDDIDVQVNLLKCLKESGQHDVLLNYVEGMKTTTETSSRLLPFATEASWATGRWLALKKYTSTESKIVSEDFNVRVGHALLALHGKNPDLFQSTVQSIREQIAGSLSTAATASLATCHDNMLKLHVLTEMEMIAGTNNGGVDRPKVLESLNRRLEVIGAYLDDKQYLLGIRRAAMQLSNHAFTEGDVASAWLTSARLARKGNAMHQSFNAVLHASQLSDDSATIEHARLLWKDGHHRKAIQNLQGAIENNAFISHDRDAQTISFAATDTKQQQNFLTARAHLLLAKWLDSAGQTQSAALRSQYQLAARTHQTWEKGHYYLGRHYNKLLETEKALAPELQAEPYLTGETAKLVIENYLRSLSYGTKYIYQTLPRILTLWLDLGMLVSQPVDPRLGNGKDFTTRITNARRDNLAQLHSRFNKYINKMPAYMFYTALPQIVARIAHPNNDVFRFLSLIIMKVVSSYPQQALWSLQAVCSSNQSDRKTRGATIISQLRGSAGKKSDPGTFDIKSMIRNGERLSEQLLMACNSGEFPSNRTLYVSLARDLHFNQKNCLPSPLAVPVERVLTATLPTLTDNVRTHKAFSRDVVTINSFQDEVMVLSSLQKPRKLTANGSDGQTYGLMCKPKDDLRKDQRLMEFNSMINRSLKRDAESSRRQLYIKTYAVTPLNEECGIIEWVDGLKTLRDILLALYKAQGVSVSYREIEVYCDEASKSEAKLPYFTEKVLGQFPPVFHKWFVQQFPEPSTWFGARLRYTRSCAVMSMVGTILGLGDRHGENILFEEGNGGTFHVDFNCLFDKGLTFTKPERVPFRLTHNMIDAMGMYGYEGPFRKSSELTLKLLRQHEETLMTILEAFVYDPTLDLVKKPEKKKKDGSVAVPHTAQGVLDSIRRKVRGLLAGESVPLGVEGQVDELIKMATNQTFLAGMYIGWCSFL